ncbi:proline-rich protein 15 [Candoia aspera]|uniref:proline-rich protein 15 n=1 Tax=Candoia aspera TaxID=51853 RepID=UPI002FD7EDA4
MADSTSAAKTHSGGPGAKGSSGTWWKSLTNRKKCKETLPATSGAPRPPAEPSEFLFAPPNTSDSRENQPPSSGSGNRRNLKISHSGRFKEKRKPRATLLVESPQKLFEGGGGGGAAPGGSAPAHASEETRCQ